MKARFAMSQPVPLPARTDNPPIETVNQSRVRPNACATVNLDGKYRGVARKSIVVLREFD
jgi:hypothetical protein